MSHPWDIEFNHLYDACRPLGEDELRVLTFLAKRLGVGAVQYGPLNLAADPRDWKKEAAEEAADLAIYTAFRALKAGL